jgi:hypothetical protein
MAAICPFFDLVGLDLCVSRSKFQRYDKRILQFYSGRCVYRGADYMFYEKKHDLTIGSGRQGRTWRGWSSFRLLIGVSMPTVSYCLIAGESPT